VHVFAALVDDGVDGDAVLPVLRSPMISSRWPRPMGVRASMTLMPVCIGSFTSWRSMMPGALSSIGRIRSAVIGAPPSIALPSASTMRPLRASPTGTEAMAAGALDFVAFRMDSTSPNTQRYADVVGFQVQRHAA
jgi:hypothetical protein